VGSIRQARLQRSLPDEAEAVKAGVKVANICSAVERIINDDSLLETLRIDALRGQIADAAILNFRLKRNIDRLALPTGNSHLPLLLQTSVKSHTSVGIDFPYQIGSAATN
jgi:hypothetical protein